MRIAAIALTFFALTSTRAAEFLNADFEDLKRRLVGPPREGLERDKHMEVFRKRSIVRFHL